jgi:uncharacterized repeat protein (TIGR03833 family)
VLGGCSLPGPSQKSLQLAHGNCTDGNLPVRMMSPMVASKKTHADASPREQTAFANNPFAKLVRGVVSPAKPASVVPAPVAAPASRRPTSPAPRLAVRHEAVGRSGKIVTRISGVPAEVRDTVAAKLGKALGCAAEVDAVDVILTGSLKERAYEWLQKVGDVRKLVEEKPRATSPAQPAPPEPPALIASNALGTYRRNIRPGMRVAIVLKEDQPTGELTTGIVRDLLTSSNDHPRGIKVRLASGLVGRVKIIYA